MRHLLCAALIGFAFVTACAPAPAPSAEDSAATALPACEEASATVWFPRDSAIVIPEEGGRMVLDELIVSKLQTCAPTQILVRAHADTSETPTLSGQRAAAVRDYLVQHGVDAGIISIEDVGTSDLMVPTEAGIAEPQNRRVQVTMR